MDIVYFCLQVENLILNYDWIADEKKYFGQPNTAYDFKANDPKEAERRIQKLTDTKEKLSKSVNMTSRTYQMHGECQALQC
jgi:structural maintenance of chromosome 2